MKYKLWISVLIWMLVGSMTSRAAYTQELLPEQRPTMALQAEMEPSSPPAKDPIGAWQAVQLALPAGHSIRQIAFATFGVWLFHSPNNEDGIWGTFLNWQDGRFSADQPETRDSTLCAAQAVAPAQVESALRKLMRSSLWQTHQAQMHNLLLTCEESQLYWSLMPVPKEGFAAGIPIKTYRAAFEP